MDDDSWVRVTLWISFPFNLGAAYILAFPSSAMGQLAGLPTHVPAIYAALTSFLVALFGAAYARDLVLKFDDAGVLRSYTYASTEPDT